MNHSMSHVVNSINSSFLLIIILPYTVTLLNIDGVVTKKISLMETDMAKLLVMTELYIS